MRRGFRVAAALIVALRLLPGCSAKGGRAPLATGASAGEGTTVVTGGNSATDSAGRHRDPGARKTAQRRPAGGSVGAADSNASSRGTDSAAGPNNGEPLAGSPGRSAGAGGSNGSEGSPTGAAANDSLSAPRAAANGSFLGGGAGGAHAMPSQAQSSDAVFVAALQSDLAKERARNQRLEQDLQQLREETSSGPFENTLDRSRKQIADLQTQLENERRIREKLTRDFDNLRQNSSYGTTGEAAQLRTELAALKQEQQEVIASIEGELAASQARERDLASKLVLALDSPTSPPFEKIADLTKENLALRARLDEEHRRNSDLSTKLATAQRVTDLIFKMQGTRLPTSASDAPALSPPRPVVAPAAAIPPPVPPPASRRPLAEPVAVDPPVARRAPEPTAVAEAPPAPAATRTPRRAIEPSAATPTVRRSPAPTRTPTLRLTPVPEATPAKPRRAFGQQMT